MPALPTDLLALLSDFNAEKDARAKHFEELKQRAESDFDDATTKLSMDAFSADWQVSQFWYTDETAHLLATQLLHSANSSSHIAVVSAPSVYIQLRNIVGEMEPAGRPNLCLLEFDDRFAVVGKDFVHYDYEQPLRLPAELKGKFDRIICDPPFLSQDCQTKTALTVRFLARDWKVDGLRFITCTGERVNESIASLYRTIGVKMTTFEPEHSQGLSNEFRCYANFECEDWKWR